jgi:hypothetical protein
MQSFLSRLGRLPLPVRIGGLAIAGITACCCGLSVVTAMFPVQRTATPTLAPTLAATATAAAPQSTSTREPTATDTPRPTATARPTETERPTNTPVSATATATTVPPTRTLAPQPTATAAPVVQPTQAPTPTQEPQPTQAPQPTAEPPTAAPIVGGYVCANNERCIKGNINSEGERIYHFPGCGSYNQTVIDEGAGERWFASSAEAEAAGWRRAGNCP